MPDLDVGEIVEKVHTILSTDAKTKTINGLPVNWQLGSLSWYGIRDYPAGLVSFGPGLDVGIHAIGGDNIDSIVPVLVRLRCASHEGSKAAEKTLNKFVSAVVDVLFAEANRKLGLTRVGWFRVRGPSVDSNPEASPPTADADLIINCLVLVL